MILTVAKFNIFGFSTANGFVLLVDEKYTEMFR